MCSHYNDTYNIYCLLVGKVKWLKHKSWGLAFMYMYYHQGLERQDRRGKRKKARPYLDLTL